MNQGCSSLRHYLMFYSCPFWCRPFFWPLLHVWRGGLFCYYSSFQWSLVKNFSTGWVGASGCFSSMQINEWITYLTKKFLSRQYLSWLEENYHPMTQLWCNAFMGTIYCWALFIIYWQYIIVWVYQSMRGNNNWILPSNRPMTATRPLLGVEQVYISIFTYIFIYIKSYVPKRKVS